MRWLESMNANRFPAMKLSGIGVPLRRASSGL